MRPRWSANTWVLVVLSTILLLSAIDVGRRVLGEQNPEVVETAIIQKEVTPPFKVGDTAPDFELPDRTGKKHRLADLVREPTMLCFLCGCANCRDLQTYMGTLMPRLGAQAPKVIGVSTSMPESEEAWIRDTRLKQTLLYEVKGGKVMEEYRGQPCPRVYRLTPERQVTWIGPSPAVEKDLTNIGKAVAVTMGFQLAGNQERGAKGPVAPPMPRPGSPGGMGMRPPGVAPSALPGHSKDDGHGH